jgi:hypothetical protein
VHVAYSDAITVGGTVKEAPAEAGRMARLMATAEARARE